MARHQMGLVPTKLRCPRRSRCWFNFSERGFSQTRLCQVDQEA
jgi:hypothetical protein